MKKIMLLFVLGLAGCATKADIRYLENRLIRSVNFIDSQISDNEERIRFLSTEMDKHFPKQVISQEAKCRQYCHNRFSEIGTESRRATNEEFIKAIKTLTEGR